MSLSAVSVRMHQVGFGDCFTLSFEYAGETPAERHVLIDFGRNRKPFRGGDMKAVAESIRQRCGRLDAIVVTHRHRDHLSAFGDKHLAPIIEACDPRLIVRSWTEVPGADASSPGPALAAPEARYLRGLAAASDVVREIAETHFALENTSFGRALRTLAFGQLENRAAVEQLDRWAASPRGAYVHFGDTSIRDVLPGVEIEVIGPPTVSQYPDVAGEATKDPDYWIALRRHLRDALAATADTDAGDDDARAAGSDDDALSPPAGPEAHASDLPAPGDIGPVRWLTEKVRKQQVASLLRIVRSMDDWLNNTSVILLIRAGDRRLLFPGDAQVEDWRYALKVLPDEPERERIRRELAQVDLYKVGHHGSRNATPKSLYALWREGAGRPVLSLMSSRIGAYPGSSDATRVPQANLVAHLELPPLRLISTVQEEHGTDDVPVREVWAPTAGPARFEERAPVG